MEYVSTNLIKAALNLVATLQKTCRVCYREEDTCTQKESCDDWDHLPSSVNLLTQAVASHVDMSYEGCPMPVPNIPLILWLDNGLVVEGTYVFNDTHDKYQFSFENGWLPSGYGNAPEFENRGRSVEKFRVVKWCYAPTPQEIPAESWRKLYGKSTRSK